MNRRMRTAVLRLVWAALNLVAFIAGIVVLILTGSAVLVTVAFVSVLISSFVGLPSDIRVLREQIKKAEWGSSDWTSTPPRG